MTSLRGVSNALQHCVHACTLLSNQRGLVQNSYALRVTMLTHLFLRVLPVPLPLRHPERSARCFWATAAAEVTHDTQARPTLRPLAPPCTSPHTRTPYPYP